MINLIDSITRICRETHFPMIFEQFGSEGVDAALQIMDVTKEFYRHVEPERISGSLIVFRRVGKAATITLAEGPHTDVNMAGLAGVQIEHLCLEVLDGGRVQRRPFGASDATSLASTAVVYQFRPGRESLFAGSQQRDIMRIDSSAASQLSIPTLQTLREALSSYAHENVRTSTCEIFRQVWFDTKRLFFRAGPEHFMRDSLSQYLRHRLGADHDVAPEQNVNKSRPVDLLVRTRLTNNRLMLIEIKWLGTSCAADGHITVTYGPARAQEGADQLATYLNEKATFAPGSVVQGYYVIIDGRRKSLKAGASSVSHADGLHFESLELTFEPAHHTTRRDFDQPYRMFARPVCEG